MLLVFVLVSFAANSLITRHVVAIDLLDGLLSAVRFVAGAIALVALTVARREQIVVGRANARPALWLGVYAVCISYGYRYGEQLNVRLMVCAALVGAGTWLGRPSAAART